MLLSYTDENKVLHICNIEDALEMECASQFDDVGQIEGSIENIIAMSRALGRLLNRLHEAGIISDDVLLNDILQGGYQKCED